MSSSLTLYDASSPLLSQRFSPSAFPQSGSWSWVGLIDSGVKGAVSVLSRYSAAGVDQYTVVIGQLVCGHFRLSAVGERRIKAAIYSLKAMKTIGNILYFGFGVDSVVRNLAATEEGGILVGLCAAACECFSEDHAANIFWELVRTFKAPEKHTPSPLQWKALLKACAGSLAETSFPTLAEHFMHLHTDGDHLSIGRNEQEQHREARSVSSPDTIAEALIAIGKVSTGDLLSISVVGGGDAGWLAAVAHWIFDLRIAVYDIKGEMVHQTSAAQAPQVQIFFKRPSDSVSDLNIAVKDQIYELRDINELFFFSDQPFGSQLVCSRVPWPKALSLTFGSAFKRLMEVRRSFIKALTSVAHVYDYIARADPMVAKNECQYCQSYFGDSRGRGFVVFAIRLFPELELLLELSDNLVPESFDSACQDFETSRAHIKIACGCLICEEGVDTGFYEKKFCLVLLMETIIVLVQSMAGISFNLELCPMRSGLEGFYRRQLKLHYHEVFQRRIEKYGAVGALMEFNNAEHQEEWNAEESVAVPRLVHAARIFTGRNIESISHEQVALSLSGIVVYLNALTDGGLPVEHDLIGRCTVVPGHIEMHGRSYGHVEDLSDYDIVGMDYRKRRGGGVAPDPLFAPSTLSNGYERVTLVAKEEVQSVRVGLLFHEGEKDVSVMLGPSILTQRVLESTGCVYCDKTTCDRTALAFQKEHSGSVRVISGGQCEKWLFCGTVLARLVALTRIIDIEPMYFKILRQDECMNCCIKAAELSEYEKAIIVTRTTPSGIKRIREG